MTSSVTGLSLYHHRDADAAARWLVSELTVDAGGPFVRPLVLVPDHALQRHLSLAIARATGVVASVRMVTPAGWIDELLQLEGREREWRPDAMTWTIAGTMRARATEMPSVVREMLAAEDRTPLLSFARTVARRFRAYLLYRPAILETWERGALCLADGDEHERWQRTLWMALVARDGMSSPMRVLTAARDGSRARPDALPPVVRIVGGPAMPPTIRMLVRHLAQWSAIRWSVVHPAPDAPARLLTDRERVSLEVLRTDGLSTTSAPQEDRPTLLASVQQIYRGQVAPAQVAADGTLTVHRCHSPLRELETLRELALEALATDATLRPHDITLYVTSLERYLPSIETVLGSTEPDRPRLPYSVAGRPYRDHSSVIAAFLHLLEAGEGRGSLRELAALLRREPIATAAGLTLSESVDAVRLLHEAGVHWGWDGEDRARRFGVPSIPDGTWAAGIDRLVVGLATGTADQEVGGVVPHGSDTTTHRAVIAALVEWTEHLASAFASWRVPRPTAEWPEIVESALRRFVTVEGTDDARAVRSIRESVERHCGGLGRADPSATCDMRVIRLALEAEFADGVGASGHLRGGLRVCALEAGNVLPCAVVLIAGMGDELHPGGTGSSSWDLLPSTGASAPAMPAEDPDGRADVLAAFRHAVCSARHRLHVAFTGITLGRQEQRAESVSVSELSSIIASRARPAEHAAIIRGEPPHPFSERLFAADVGAGSATPSSSTRWATAATHLRRADRAPFVFAPEPVASGGVTKRIRLESLANCIEDPTRFFCKRVLGIRFPTDSLLPEHEPLDAGHTFLVGDGDEDDAHLVDHMFRPISWRVEAAQRRGDRRSRSEIAAWIRRQPEMPLGALGERTAEIMAAAWWERIVEMRTITWHAPREVRCRIGVYEIVGRIDRLTSLGRRIVGFYKHQPYSAIQDWVRHLVLNAVDDLGDVEPRTTVDVPAGWALMPLDEAQGRLESLCVLYESAHLGPVPLFRRTAVELLKEKSSEKARVKAHRSWNGSPGFGGPPRLGESVDPWHRLCWAARDILEDDAFYGDIERLARDTIGPFLSCITDLPDAEMTQVSA